jgi:serine/threonine protein kinase
MEAAQIANKMDANKMDSAQNALKKDVSKLLYGHFDISIDEIYDIIDSSKIKKLDCNINDAISGTYGSVQMKLSESKKIYAVKTIINRDADYIPEILFLKSLYDDYSSQFLPKIIDIKITDKIIKIYMTYCGRDLGYYIQNNVLPEETKLKILPSIIIQFGSILSWMKSHGIVHKDIKPQNICIDFPKGRIFLIDWGFVATKNIYSKYCGTHQFAMPNALLGDKIVDYEDDMYACGITLLSFISRRYLRMHEYLNVLDDGTILDYSFLNYKSEFISTYNSTFLLIYNRMGEKYENILKRMVYYKEKDIELTTGINVVPALPTLLELFTDISSQNFHVSTRARPILEATMPVAPITPIELYNIYPDDQYLNKIRAKYPLEGKMIEDKIIECPLEEISKKRTLYDNQLKNKVVIFMAEICLRKNALYLFYHSIQIFNKLPRIDNIIELKLYGLSCILITNYIFHSIDQNGLCSIKYVKLLMNNLYSMEQILTTITNICNMLNWKLYPNKECAYTTLSLDVNWLKIFYIPDETYTEKKYDIMTSKINTNIEEYMIRENVKNTLYSIIKKII